MTSLLPARCNLLLRLAAVLPAALLVAALTPALAEEPVTAPARQLPGVTVEGKKNPFEESDRRLKELLEKSAPCIGCDAKKPELEPNIAEQILDTATGLFKPQASQPLNHDDNAQRDVDRALNDRIRPANSNP